MLGPDGDVDRQALGRRVFGDPAALRALNALVHPEIGRLLRRRLATLERQGESCALIDAALYLDVDLGVPVDAVIAVTAPRALRRQRLLQRGGLTAAEIDSRLDSQTRIGVWTRRADYRLDASGSLEDLQERVDDLWQRLQRQRRRKRGG
jgi:dephospho-CoA kinase